jgi:multisubunit Na+/H+ antiporter MnhB subunit
MGFIAGVVVGMVLVVLVLVYDALRQTRPPPSLLWDEWCDEEARALEAAEEILRGGQP